MLGKYDSYPYNYITFYRVDKDTHCKDEPKFLVFYSRLLALFSVFCFNCKEDNPNVKMKSNGTMVTVYQDCKNCGSKGFQWRSQPLVLGRYPAGNILLSYAILMAGGSVAKVLLVCRHMGLAVYSVRTFFVHQAKFLFPVILQFWEIYQAKLISHLKTIKNVTWCGDGRFDSMGHCAKYEVYSMFCSTINKVVHFQLLQVFKQSCITKHFWLYCIWFVHILDFFCILLFLILLNTTFCKLHEGYTRCGILQSFRGITI